MKRFYFVLRWMLSLSIVITSPGIVLGAEPQSIGYLKKFIKMTDTTNEQSLAEFLIKAKPLFHKKTYNRLLVYSELNPGARVPKMDIKKIDGVSDQVRIFMTLGNQVETFDIKLKEDLKREDQIVNYKKEKYSYNDLFFDAKLENIKPNGLLTLGEIKRLYQINPVAAQTYLFKYKELITALEEYYKVNGSESEVASLLSPWWLPSAEAADGKSSGSEKKTSTKSKGSSDYSVDGSQCVVAGHLSTVVKGSCGGGNPSEFRGPCKDAQLYCNPLAFGFEQQSNSPICVPQKPAELVSIKCDEISNSTYSDKKSLVKDIVNKCKTDTITKFSPCTNDAYINSLQEHIKTAFNQCSPIQIKGLSKTKGEDAFEVFRFFKSSNVGYRVQPEDILKSWVNPKEEGGHHKGDEHHRNACAVLLNRFLDLEEEAKKAIAIIEEVPYGHEHLRTPVATQLAPVETAVPKVVVRPPPEKKDQSWLPFLLLIPIFGCLISWCKDSKTTPPIGVGKPGEDQTIRPITNPILPISSPPLTRPATK